MLTIRMQRTGRKGHAMFRIVVQDSRRTPTSGKIVAALGHYDPHSKSVKIDKEKVSFYLEHGAQPSDRIISLLVSEKVTMPKWVSVPKKQEGKIRNPEKLRRNRPDEPVEEKPVEETPVETKQEAETEASEAKAEPQEEVVAEEAKTEEPEKTEKADGAKAVEPTKSE